MRQSAAEEHFVRNKRKQTENKVQPEVLMDTCSPAWLSASPSSVSSPLTSVPHPSSVLLHMSVWLTVCLSLTTRRLREHSIDLCFGGGGSVVGAAAEVTKCLCVIILYRNSINRSCATLRVVCVSVKGKLRRMQGRKHFKGAQVRPAAASEAVFSAELR